MANLTIKNVPGPVVRRLKARAATHRRSLNLELIACLEALVQSAPVDADSLLARVREVRRIPARTRLTDRVLTRLKIAGRT
jgi:plasmid stability protein